MLDSKILDSWREEALGASNTGESLPLSEDTLAQWRNEYIEETRPESRGLLSGAAASVGRGALDLIESTGQGLQMLDATPGAIDEDESWFDRAGSSMAEWAKDKQESTPFLQRTKEEMAGEPGFIRRGFEGALQSMPLTAGPFATGAVGMQAGSVFGPVGTGVGAVVGGLAGLAFWFGAGTYGKTYDEAYAELKEARPDASEEEIREVAAHGATVDAVAEVGGEGVSDLAAMLTFGGSKLVTQPLTKSLKQIVKGGFKDYAKSTVKHMPFEVGSEMGTAYAQADWRQEEGLQTETPMAAMGESILPSVFMSMIFGTAAATQSQYSGRKLLAKLNSKDP
ncbi:MAG: hypothetical protein EOM03_19205, partial [Clostridia bacterium]|nr:hypothetical protein [Clostridia bacterium]